MDQTLVPDPKGLDPLNQTLNVVGRFSSSLFQGQAKDVTRRSAHESTHLDVSPLRGRKDSTSARSRDASEMRVRGASLRRVSVSPPAPTQNSFSSLEQTPHNNVRGAPGKVLYSEQSADLPRHPSVPKRAVVTDHTQSLWLQLFRFYVHFRRSPGLLIKCRSAHLSSCFTRRVLVSGG